MAIFLIELVYIGSLTAYFMCFFNRFSRFLSLPVLCFGLLFTSELGAQIPNLNLSKEELLRRVEADSQDDRHFNALAQLIRLMANDARSGTNSVYPDYDPTRPIRPYLQDLGKLGAKLGDPYPARVRITELHMKALACPNLSVENRRKIPPLYKVIQDSLGTNGSPENLELRLGLHAAMYFQCNRDSFPFSLKGPIAEDLYQEPGLTDSQRVVLSLYMILDNFTVGDSERGREIIRNSLRTAEEMEGGHHAKARLYMMLADFFQQFTGDYEKGAELLHLAQDNLGEMEEAYSDYGNVVSNSLVQTYSKLKKYDVALTLLDSLAEEKGSQSPMERLEATKDLYDLAQRLELCRKSTDTLCQENFEQLLAGMELANKDEGYEGLSSANAQAGLYYHHINQDDKARPLLAKTFEKIKVTRWYPSDLGTEVVEAYKETLGDGIDPELEVELYQHLLYWSNNETSVARSNASSKAAFELGVTENKLARQRAEQQTILAEQDAASDRRFYSILLGALALLLAVIGYSFYRSRRDGQKLANQKALVDQSLSEKEVLLREIHHRVKNNLQIISSLLQKQGRLANDSDAQKLAKEGQERIQSMALIHENLYQSEQLSGVNIRSYLEDLGTNISRSHSKPGKDIKLDLVVADEYLDLDTAIPVGLILNELLTNAYKYAFPNGSNGQIQVVFQRVADRFELEVNDNGVGLPADHAARSSKSLGHNLVKGLVRQLEGSIKWMKPERGTTVQIEF